LAAYDRLTPRLILILRTYSWGPLVSQAWPPDQPAGRGGGHVYGRAQLESPVDALVRTQPPTIPIVLAPFPPRPLLFLLFALKSLTFSLLSPPSTLSHRRQASWPAHPGTTKPTRPCGPANTLEISHWPTKSYSPPQELSTWQHFSAVGAAGSTASLADDSEAAVPSVLGPLVAPSPATRASAAILPLAPIKSHPRPLELAAPNPTH
jgi:hypothetical protein